jgi:hypothetical protein
MRKLSVQLCLCYFALIAVIGIAGAPAWHIADWYAVGALANTASAPYSDTVTLVDVTTYSPDDVRPLRRTLSAFIDRLALLPHSEQPMDVVLDFWFSSGDASPETAHFKASLSAAARAGLKLYAPVNPPVENDFGENIFSWQQAGKFEGDDALRDQSIYLLLASAGHTEFDAANGPNILSFRPCLKYPSAFGMRDIFSLALVVAGRTPAICKPDDVIPLLIAPDAHIPGKNQKTLDAGLKIAPADIAQKHLILGSVKYDRGDFGSISHPEVFAWALSGQLVTGGVPDVQPARVLLPIPVLGTALTSLLAFLALFMLSARRRSRNRLALPWYAALISAATALILFLGVEALFAHGGTIQPQVSLPITSAIIAAALCGFWGRAWTINQIRLKSEEEMLAKVHDYDVFISYAHEEYDWVVQHIYEPLREVTTAKGRLKIFFDQDQDRKSIEVSDLWMDTLALSIGGSRCVILVYSDIYFTKNYCRFELRQAHRRQIESSGRWMGILPVMHGPAVVPAGYDDIQGAISDKDPDFMQRLIDRILREAL